MKDDNFCNLIEIVATARPNPSMPGYEEVEEEMSSGRGEIDEEAHYRKINGKFGIFAELKELNDKD